MCDRHPRTKATDEITIHGTDTTYDICEECAALVEAFFAEPKKEAVEPKQKKRGILGLRGVQH